MSITTSHAIGRTDAPLIEDTIGHHFEAIARRFPQREVLVSRHQGQRLTYAQLDHQGFGVKGLQGHTGLQGQVLFCSIAAHCNT